MHLSKRKITLTAVIVSAFLVVGANAFFQNYFTPKKFEVTDGLRYQKLVKPEDTAPLPLPKPGHSIKIPILMYHHIGEPPALADAVYRGLSVSVANFEAQVKWLKDSGYTTVSLENIYNFSLGKFSLPKQPVAFSFDDGYKDVFSNAIPILSKYGFSGSFGIITQFPGTISGSNVYATWDDISKARGLGNEIVCHTQNHFDGTSAKFNANYIFTNLLGCKDDIYNHLGITSQILIYPYGHYNSTYLEQARKAGFKMGITVHEGDVINLDDLMQVPRVRVHGNETLERFKEIILDQLPHSATGR